MPTAAEALNNAWKIHQSGEVAQAEQVYRQVVAAEPNNASAWCYLGMACHDQERFDEAIAAYQRSIELRPSLNVAFNNLGNSYRQLKRVDEAIVNFDRAIALKPDYLIAFKNKATTLCWAGRVREALAVYEQAVKFATDNADVHKHIGIMRLLLGDYAGGWPEYEWRWKTGEIKLPQLSIPQWDGSSLDGMTILLTPEQGLGDTIHFIRYAAWLKERYSCQVAFQCPATLRALLATCQGIDTWVNDLSIALPADVFSPLVHVPGVLKHEPRDFPAKIPYLSADESLVETWRQRLAGFDGLKVGIAWRGSPTHHADVMRSIPLAEFAPLGNLKGVHYFSLQKGPAAEELNTLAGRLAAVDLGRQLDESTGAFVETAAVLKNLDLLITCDTAIAHVAGALGVKVWMLLANVPDWRWLMEGDSTPWYPTMRLFRQTAPGDWAGVLNRVAVALLQEFSQVSKKEYTDYHLATSGFNRLATTRHGLMLYNRHDKYIGHSIDRYGEFSIGEVELFQQAVRPGWTVVEAGSNIGAHTLVLSNQVGNKGLVYAFEPQRVVFQTLCANMALNSIVNVHCRPEALGESSGTINVPALDYATENNFGGLSLGGRSGEPVPVITLDSLNLPRCDFLKIDVEGMELSVLKGAANTIERCRPVLYVENDRPRLSSQLIAHLLGIGYHLYWHLPPFWNANNFYQNPVNEFGNIVSINMLGIHSSVASEIRGLRKIESPESDWRGGG